MRWHEVINEFDLSKTVQTFAEKLTRRVRSDRSASKFVQISDESTPEATAEAVIQYFESVDPTKKNIFVLPMINWYVGGSMRLLEDATKAVDSMNLYVKFKNRLSGVNLKTITFDAFLDIGDQLSDVKSGKEQDKSEERAFYENGSAELYHDDPQVKIVIPKTEEASIYFGKNTRWCTAASKGANMFREYDDQGKLYVVLFKKQNVRWQFHFETNSFMDEQDKPITDSAKLTAVLKQYFPSQLKTMQESGIPLEVFNFVNAEDAGNITPEIAKPVIEWLQNVASSKSIEQIFNEKNEHQDLLVLVCQYAPLGNLTKGFRNAAEMEYYHWGEYLVLDYIIDTLPAGERRETLKDILLDVVGEDEDEDDED